MSRTICNHQSCTGCAACRDVCPQKSIYMEADQLDALYPVIDETNCTNCGLCYKTCPNNRTLLFHYPQKVFAGWSKHDEVRRTSASGGIACELYKYWIRKGGIAAGVVYNRDGEGCHFILIEDEKDINATKNSKYTFSDTAGIYKVIKERLNASVPVLFIGVPCQIAGLYGFLKKDYDYLVTVDIMCHGMPPATYLEKHIKSLERIKQKHCSELSFRNPKYYTYTYTFTLTDSKGEDFYKKKALSTDNFQLGYHKSLIYRENCYHCLYARKERIADLTLGDFSGLGRFAPFTKERQNVSCILQNTERGASLIKSLVDISIEERPEREAFDVEKMLQRPSVKHKNRATFESVYKLTKDFTNASNSALKSEKIVSLVKLTERKLKTIARKALMFLHIKKTIHGR